ncbi:ovalbumin-related protein Y-like [Rhynchocyon petersi]
MDLLSTANAQFCFDVFKEMSRDHTAENLFLSPVGLLSTLAVVLFGARGDSASQMNKCGQDTGVHSHIQALLSEISTSSRGQVDMASGMFVDVAHPFLPKYVECIEKLYKLKPENLDFKHNTEVARVQINSWVQNQTKGKIPGLLSSNDIVSSDRLVLINTISFRGPWKHEKDQTQVMTFRMSESQNKLVQMRRLQGLFKLGSIQEPEVQILEVPNAKGDLSLIIILPRENVGLGQVLREITYEKLKSWLSSVNMADTAVDLFLPRLRLEGFQEDLTSILEALGMTDVLDPSLANLSGITAEGGLAVSKIIHKTILEVTEGDSESASATQAENPEVFLVDHPFLFSILWKKTETILFYGAVTNP